MGVKSIYSRSLINLALELHIEPKYLYNQMFRIRRQDSPLMQQLWNTYAEHPKRLAAEVEKLREMSGFGQKDVFYKDVEVNCICGANFKINATVPGPIKVETCYQCHPAFNENKEVKKVIK